MHNMVVGKPPAASFVANSTSIALIIFASLWLPRAEAKRQYMVPPPPPTIPSFAVPPPPVRLPYNEALFNFNMPPTVSTMAMMAPPALPAPSVRMAPHAVQARPNFIGLSLHTAESRGFGKPRVNYNRGNAPGAAYAAAHRTAPPMNTWFDSSMRWYANHNKTAPHYNSLANQAPYWTPDAQLTASAAAPSAMPPLESFADLPMQSGSGGGLAPARPLSNNAARFKHAKRVIVSR